MELVEIYKGFAMNQQGRKISKMDGILNTTYVQFYLFLSSFCVCF